MKISDFEYCISVSSQSPSPLVRHQRLDLACRHRGYVGVESFNQRSIFISITPSRGVDPRVSRNRPFSHITVH